MDVPHVIPDSIRNPGRHAGECRNRDYSGLCSYEHVFLYNQPDSLIKLR